MSKSAALIVLSGLPCCGKSTVAEAISNEFGFPIFSVDPIESAIIRANIPKSFETGLAAYLVTESLASEQLKLGHSVIIDSVNAVNEAKQMWRDLAKSHKVNLILIQCICSDESIHQDRVNSRVRNMKGLSEVTWPEVLERLDEFTPWPEPVLLLDAVEDKAQNIKKAIEYVRSG